MVACFAFLGVLAPLAVAHGWTCMGVARWASLPARPPACHPACPPALQPASQPASLPACPPARPPARLPASLPAHLPPSLPACCLPAFLPAECDQVEAWYGTKYSLTPLPGGLGREGLPLGLPRGLSGQWGLLRKP